MISFVLCTLMNFCIPKLDSTGFNDYFSITFGNKNINKTKITSNSRYEYFDFLQLNDNQQLSVQFRKKFKNKSAISFRALAKSDLAFRNFELFYSKLKYKNFGYNFGTKSYNLYLLNYQFDNLISSTTTYENTNSNITDSYLPEKSFFWGPIFFLNRKYFSAETRFNFGYGYLGKFRQKFLLESNNSFELLQIESESKHSPYFIFNPEISFSTFPVLFKKSKLGINANANYQKIKRSFDYTLTKRIWNYENAFSESVKGTQHTFRNFELNIGLIWQQK